MRITRLIPPLIRANRNRCRMMVMEAFDRAHHDSGYHGRGQEQPPWVKALLDNRRWLDRWRSFGWVAEISGVNP